MSSQADDVIIHKRVHANAKFRIKHHPSLSERTSDSNPSTLRSIYLIKETTHATPKESDNKSICRVCFDPASKSKGRLITPCHCSGTALYIHESCLKTWIKQQSEEHPGFRPKCEICTFEYLHQFEISSRYSGKRTISTLWVTMLIILLGAVVLIGIIVLFSFISNRSSEVPLYVLGSLVIGSIIGIIAYRLRNCEMNRYEQVFKNWKILNLEGMISYLPNA